MQAIRLITFGLFCYLILFRQNLAAAERFDVVIDEVFANPTPAVGLPAAEFIEVKNISGKDVNLQGWSLNSLTTKSGAFPSIVLRPDSFLIITSLANASAFSSFGKTIGISSFPSLNNQGGTLWLTSKEGATVHAVRYSNKWYQNDVKSNGGWSLEMIDTHNPCSGINNWKASIDSRGGTPGTKNSVDAPNPDKIAPALTRAAALDSITFTLTFDEPVDSVRAAMPANYNVDRGVGSPKTVAAIPPLFTQVRLTMATPITANTVYTIMATNVTDCAGNKVHAANSTRGGLATAIDSFDVIINEILFNPKPGAVDYVELYNRSNKIFNLKDMRIASRSTSTGSLTSIHRLTGEDNLIFPGDFFVISASAEIVRQNYFAKNPDNFIDVAMPSFPDREGFVVILNAQGKIIDELRYSSKWHFALVDNEKGIALERIDYNKPSQNKDNWTSAASTAGFGTPTYQNSQLRLAGSVQAGITVTPKTFSPDNDGFDDFTTINITMSEPGYIANITLFDAVGRPVKDLVKNASLSQTASFRWDGLDDKFRKVPAGVYVVYTEAFNLSGKKKSFKNTVIVATRF